MNIVHYIFLYFLLVKFDAHGITPISGDVLGGFSFPLLNILCDSTKNRIFVCAQKIPGTENSKKFGIAGLEKYSKNFIPLIQKDTIINGHHKENPLYGKSFRLSCVSQCIVNNTPMSAILVVPTNEEKVYGMVFQDNLTKTNQIVIMTDEILLFDNTPGTIFSIQAINNGFAVFSSDSSYQFPDERAKITCSYFTFEASIKQVNSLNNVAILTLKKTKTINIIPDPALFSFNNGSLELNNIIESTNNRLSKTYYGVSGNGENGLRSIAVDGREFIPENVCNDDSIIATTSQEKNIILKNICHMVSSTYIEYLIVNGGILGDQYVFGLPIINDTTSSLCGKLASINDTPNYIFSDYYPNDIKNIFLSKAPETTSDVYNSGDIRAIVGQGLIIPNQPNIYSIDSIETYGDSVFAFATYQGSQSGASGIFYSQGLINEKGVIQGWTPWQRKSIVGKIYSPVYSPHKGGFIGFLGPSNSVVCQNSWMKNGPCSIVLEKEINELSCAKTGIETIIDIPYQHPGVGIDSDTYKSSFALYLGYQTVILAQTARNNTIIPEINKKTFYTKNDFSNFDISQNYTSIISTNNNFGTIIAGALAYTDFDSWIIIGGSNGLFILCDNENKGMGTQLLNTYFSGIKNSMKWQKINGINSVKKIISQKNNIYILGDNGIYKINLNNESESPQNFIPIQIASGSSLSKQNSYITDFLASNNTLIIGTTDGIFINTVRINEVLNINNQFKKITLPNNNNQGCISLSPISTTGWIDDWASGNNLFISGNIYAVVGDIANHQSYVYRFATYNSTQVDDPSITVIAIPNYFIKDMPTYFYKLKDSKLSCENDGASFLSHYQYEISHGNYNGILENYKYFDSQFSGVLQIQKKQGTICKPAYISGLGIWTCPSLDGIYQLW